MEQTKLLSSSLLEILFDGRNKAYGAYELRSTYNRRLTKALTATGLLIAAFIGMSFLKLGKKPEPVRVHISEGITIEKIDEPKKIPTPAPAPPKLMAPKKMETRIFVIPKITPDKLVTDPPPTQTELVDVKIGMENSKGDKIGNRVIPPAGVPDGTGVLDLKYKDKDDDIATFVQVEAKYPGDWARFLTTNLRGDTPVENGATPNNYQVLVQFVVDVDGSVSDIKVLKDPGFGMGEEAVRVIKKSGKWKPAIQNGYPVKAYRKQPITFQVLEQ